VDLTTEDLRHRLKEGKIYSMKRIETAMANFSETLTLANQLGAEVFTRKGDDIASAILQFAKEYRVGHIVIGRPGKMPTWKRLLGKRNVVEHLLEQAGGITIVILDTRKYDDFEGRILDPRAGRGET